MEASKLYVGLLCLTAAYKSFTVINKDMCPVFHCPDKKILIIKTQNWRKYYIFKFSKMSKIYIIVQLICWCSLFTRAGDLLIQVIGDEFELYNTFFIFFVIRICCMVHFHVHINMLQIHKKWPEVTNNNSYLEFKTSDF